MSAGPVPSLFVHGTGAVSPAGWDAGLLTAAVLAGQPLASTLLPAPGNRTLAVRRVPPPDTRAAWRAHPRLRRASVISSYAVSAALEALGPHADPAARGDRTLGILCAVMSGSVAYSRRFYAETLADPTTASPLLFPETVFNAPAAHVAAVLGTSGPNLTLVSDQTGFLGALAIAADWLVEGRVGGCLVLAVEEADWVTADALATFARGIPTSEGAAALYLRTDPGRVELAALTNPAPYRAGRGRVVALRQVRAQLPPGGPADYLFDSRTGHAADALEATAWRDWAGPSVSCRRVLGEGFAAAGGWPCVAAVRCLDEPRAPAACVNVVGSNLQVAGALFRRVTGTPESGPAD